MKRKKHLSVYGKLKCPACNQIYELTGPLGDKPLYWIDIGLDKINVRWECPECENWFGIKANYRLSS